MKVWMKYTVKKFISLVISLLFTSIVTFTAFQVIPGDSALSALGMDATEKQLEEYREEMGLSILVEQVFNLPGLGRLLVSSIANRDYAVVQAIVLYIASVVIIINFLVDLIYQWIDPRVKRD
jgi:ABC-type dipeptide/oligopeptide/nickel transport system permease component